ncbi:MAG TPA: aldo/keto reductase [Thermoanaerobaculia bacterium]|jgi:aryl-alcohol dehydrogenase-like predicted oxidoreductase|nr:aldo/keto reductase [Thermoanaerobaculia bacterium]
MQKTTLGDTGEAISVIGFGGMPLSIQGRPPEEQGKRTLHAAIDAGMTFIDTADVYCLDDNDIGHNEQLIASVLAERPDRDEIRVATKAGLRRPRGAWTNDGRPEHIREACEKSLRALQTEQIWLYQFHAPDSGVPFEQSVEAFAELHRAGKFKWFGLSNVSVKQIEQAQQILPVVSVQNRLNPYFRESIKVAQECARRKITFLAYSPVGGGRLAKKLTEFDVLIELARKYDRSVHAIVIAWVRAQAETIVPIPAARAIEHAVDSARAWDLVLAEEDVRAIEEADFDRT